MRFLQMGGLILALAVALAGAPTGHADDEPLQNKGKIKIGGHKIKMDINTLYLITAKGKGFQPLVLVCPEEGRDGGDSYITQPAYPFLPTQKGNHRLLVFPSPNPTLEEGDYDYTLQVQPIPLAEKPLVKEDNKWAENDPPYRQRNTPFKGYTIQMKAGQYYIIDLMRKGEQRVDPYLFLEDAEGKVVANDDDGGDGRNARLVYRPQADGEFRIIATMLFRAAGDYSLMVRTQKK